MFGSQTLITGGRFQQQIYHHATFSKDPFDRLLEAASPTAFHNSNDLYDPPKCHPNTRAAVLNKIMNWIWGLDPETRDTLIMWLYGPAGSGKSAIARSIAERCYEEGILVASYFFSRSDSTRSHVRSLIATIAYQASIRFPDIRDHIIRTVDLDPFIFTRSLDAQLLGLVIEPLQKYIETGCFDAVTAPNIVIIDGLDECDGRESQVNILITLSQALQQHHLPLIFLIASRPEHDIMCTFDGGYLDSITKRLALNNDYLPSADIRLFLQDKFTEIKRTHPFKAQIPLTWPADQDLQELVRKSSGQFVYASAVIKFITSSRHRPPQRLDIILGLRLAHHEMPFAELDALYKHILSSVKDQESVLRIFALHFLLRSSSASEIENILSLNTSDLAWLLCDLTSLISVEDQSDSEGRHWRELNVFHASLRDFFLDYSRSQEFYIRDPSLCARLAHLCIHCLQEGTKNYRVAKAAVNLLCNTRPTPDLHDDLTNVSLGSHLMECGVPYLIPRFITCIKLWKFDDSFNLHAHQLRLFDKSAQGIMEKMYLATNLTALVTIVKISLPRLPFFQGMDLFQLDETQRALDKLSFSMLVHLYPEYCRFISDFLVDPNRSGLYALNGQRYATAAVYFLKHISNHSKQILPSFPKTTRRKYRRQRNFPWLWRKLVQQAHSSESAKIIKLRLKRLELLAPYRLSVSDEAFDLALKCLVHVLPFSDSSERLTTLARRQKFFPLLRKDTHLKRALTREISRYLSRVDAEDSVRE